MITMNKLNDQHFHDDDHHHHHEHEHEHDEQDPCSSIEEASTISNLSSSSTTCSSSCSFDTTDEASSANSSRSSLYDMSDLMSHLPIKRGLSKFYHGKSDSFTSLARVTSIEDIPKKEKMLHKKMKKKKSYRSHTLPKPIISKKNSRKKKFE